MPHNSGCNFGARINVCAESLAFGNDQIVDGHSVIATSAGNHSRRTEADRYNFVAHFTNDDSSTAVPLNTSTTASMQMGYAPGSDNTIRPTSLTYPNGRVLTYDYCTSGGITDAANQISSIDSDELATPLAQMRYLGLGTIVMQDSLRAYLRYTLVDPTGGTDPVTGDVYSGLDTFGRVKDVRWRALLTASDLSRVQYGYNRASSRVWRANPTDPAFKVHSKRLERRSQLALELHSVRLS